MRTKYRSVPKATIKKPRADDDYDYGDNLDGIQVLTVTSWEPYQEDTGLVDANGDSIVREVSPNPVGFGYIYED